LRSTKATSYFPFSNSFSADDELSVLESFKMILSLKDYEVETFEDGNEVLKDFKPGKYDVGFVDIYMPKLNGLELLKILKEKDPKIEVAVVTAYADEQSHATAINLNALEYLRKPFLMEEIYELVERGLNKRAQK
ncbi:response regulator, partial [Candidatus Margulisiibacteriota bacterium]